ncbi:hypothetical protein ACFQUU_27400 [Herbaspirillum sp. GCM10030257]|uniref:hypothetical protein n=1 Tax=Herbaspirillum sp. GCM10030257 TaxID=3273393 RepID=UPI00361A24E4
MNIDIKQLFGSGFLDCKEYMKNFSSLMFFQTPHCHPKEQNSFKSLLNMIDDLCLPKVLKTWLKEALIEEQADALPSAKSAANTIKSFQKKELGGAKISVEQMKEMADTGYLTKSNGTRIKVSEKVQRAAQAFMVNGGELFARVESAGNGKHDGLLSIGDIDCAKKKHLLSDECNEFSYEPLFSLPTCELYTLPACWDDLRPSEKSAAKTIQHLQKHHLGGGMLTVEQMQLMAETGYLKKPDGSRVQISAKERAAARAFMADGGALFARVESIKNGQHDGKLSMSDINVAREKGKLSSHQPCIDDEGDDYTYRPLSRNKAANAIHDFMKAEAGCAMLSVEQMEEIAETGYLTKGDGTRIRVSDNVRNAAEKIMENGGGFFATLESATTGGHDGKLSFRDIEKWAKKK